MQLPTFDRPAGAAPPADWPGALKTIHSLVMTATQPMMVAGGPDLIAFYNPAFIPILGRKHPHAMGQPYRAIWSEVWPTLQPLISPVLDGEATYVDSMAFALEGRDDRIMGWFSFSLTPVRDDAGAVAGFLVVVSDTTETVLLQRRQRFGLELERVLRKHAQPQRVLQAAADLLGPYLHVMRCAYAEVTETAGLLSIEAGWAADNTPGLAGQHSLSVFSPAVLAGLRAGEAVRINRVVPSGSFLLRTALIVPVIAAGALVALLLVDQDTPRHWTDAEEGLVHDVAERTWAAAAHARTETEIQELNHTLELRVAERTTERDRLWSSAQELITVVDQNYTFVSVNPACRTILGYDPQDLLGRTVFELMHPDDVLLSRRNITTYRPRESRVVENRYRHASGAYRTIAWNVVFDGDVFYARGRDVTTERETVRALQESEARLQAVFESSYQLKWLLRLDGSVMAVNATAQDAIGTGDTQGQAFWATPWFNVTAGMAQQIEAAVLEAQAGRAHQSEIELDLPGGLRRFDLSIRPVLGLDGTTIAIMPEALDVTERRVTEEALRQSQKMEAVGQLTGGLAHDFNNLLTGIGGALDMIKTRLVQGRGSEIPAYVGTAQDAARRAAALTHRLLAFSRRQTLSPRRIDANDLVHSMVDLIRRTVGPGVALVVNATPGLPPVLADANQLENAILNLCLNAQDAMPAGGTLTIDTAVVPGEADLPAGPLVALTVSDTGTGMAQGVAARAFDPFFTTKPLGTGTGLGLSMVYGFARQSGGEARIMSHSGEGTAVTLYFPAQPGLAPATTPLAPPPPAPGRGETVLVVEDEGTIRMLIGEVLCDCGYTVLLAEDGPAALRVLQSTTAIDVMLTDIGLPNGINGRQLAELARSGRPGLPVLLMSGFAAGSVLGDGLLEPGMALLTKPFTMAALTLRLQELLTP